MASYMSTFRKRISKMESQGFVIPKYIKNITREKTARKYTMERIAEKSKFREIYKGEERIVSGAYGIEKLRSEAGKKAAETRKERERERERDWNEWDGEDIQEWEERKEQLQERIVAILHTFHSERLANMIEGLFKKRDREDGVLFWNYILDAEYSVISRLQEDSLIPSDALALQNYSYQTWITFLSYGTVPSKEEREEIARIAEEDEAYEDEEM